MPSLIAYHGSPKLFTDGFRPGAHKRGKQLGFGIHFTKDLDFAGKYGRYVYEVRLTYTNLLDATKVYERGTPEFDLGIELFRGTSQAHMGVHFKEKGVVPINLDITSPKRAVELLRKHGFDCVKYTAVVTQWVTPKTARRLGDAEAYVVLDPSQVEIRGAIDQNLVLGKEVKKEWNPAALDPGSADYVLGEVSSFGLIDSTGKVVKAVKGDTNHNAVAHRLGFKSTTDALKRGHCIRFLISLNGNAGFSYWADKDSNKETLTRILRFVESEQSVNGGFDAYNIYDNSWVDGVDYDDALNELKRLIRVGNPYKFTKEQYDELKSVIAYEGEAAGFYDADNHEMLYQTGEDGDHNEMATRLGYTDTAQALEAGLVRFYIRERDEIGISFASRFVDAAIELLLAIPMNVKVYADSVNSGSWKHKAFEADTPKELVRKLRQMAAENPATRNGIHHADHPHSGTSRSEWGYFKGTKVVDGLKAPRDIRNHDALAQVKTIGVHDEEEALQEGWVRYITNKYVSGELLAGFTAWSPSSDQKEVAAAAKSILVWLTKTSVPVTHVNMEFRYGLEDNDDFYADHYSDLPVVKAKETLKRIMKGDFSVRNGLHHADSPRNWPADWDDFDGLPWGFIAPDGTLVDGLAHDEDVNEHDTLAALHIFGKEGMADAEWKAMESGYVRYLVNTYRGLDPPFRLGLDGIGKFAQVAEAMIKGYKKLDFPVGAFDAGIHDPSQRPSKQDVYLSGVPKRILGALKRLAAGESIDEVQQMLRSTASQENPYAFSKAVTRFGFIKPNAAVVNAKKDEMAHQEVAERLGFPTEHAALSKGGLVRFLVYKDGQSDMEIDTDLGKVAGAIKGFVTKSPDISGIVTLDAPRATPYWSIHANSPKEFIARMNARVAGRVENGIHHSSKSQYRNFTGTPGPWGYFMPNLNTGKLKIINGLDYPAYVTNHDQLALAMKMNYSNEKDALADGWVRFLVSHHETGDIQLLTSISMTTKGRDRDYVKDTLPVIRKFYKQSEIPFTHITFDVLVYGSDSFTPKTYSVTTDPPNMDNFIRRVQAGESFKELMSARRNNPSYGGHDYPFKLRKKADDLYEVEFFDHYKVLVGTTKLHEDDDFLVWMWKDSAGQHGEARERFREVLIDLSLIADQHTGRLGGAMKFVIYNQRGNILGTVSAPNRAAARDKLRGQLSALRAKTTADLFLYPWLNSAKEVQQEADNGLTIQ